MTRTSGSVRDARAMRKFVRENALTIVMAVLFVLSLAGQAVAGWDVYNADQEAHDQPAVGLGAYLTGPHFGEAVFENWESEFLQMGLFVLLTARLRQKGSPESKSLDDDETHESEREMDAGRPGAPLPVRAGGVVGRVYAHSLSIALLALFVLSFALHVVNGAAEFSAQEVEHGGSPVSAIEFLGTPELWFQSFQNWQSEFLSIAALAVLSIFLREHGSSQSKPVDAPHAETGA
jgi:hypothetical protein